jgi:hypothetical protein
MFQRHPGIDGVLLGLLALSLITNVCLVWRAHGGTQTVEGHSLAVGTAVPDLQAVAADGTPVTVKVNGATLPTVVYALSTNCMWCQRNKENIQAVIEQGHNRFHFVILSLGGDDPESVIGRGNPSVDVLTKPSKETWIGYGLGTTPQTIVVATDGRVVRNWEGAFAGLIAKDVSAFFGVRLPTEIAFQRSPRNPKS